MAHRVRPPPKFQVDESRDDIDGGCTPLAPPSCSGQLVMHIADALQVSPEALYGLPTTRDARSGTGADVSTAEGGLDRECAILLNAFRRIRNPADRRRLLRLVQDVAERA